MLYLVRKLNESIIINENIEIKVIEVKGKSVKLGFEFPNTATVLRKEIHERIVAENKAAQMSHASDADLADAFSGLGDATFNLDKDTLVLPKKSGPKK